MLAPHVSAGRLQILLDHEPIAADVAGDRVRTVSMRDRRGGGETVLAAPYFLDATELGDLLPLTKTEFTIGAESRRDTGEPHALAEAQPLDQQAFTWCFAMDYRPGEDHTIDRPADYAFWRDYVPAMTPAWPGSLLSWQMSDPRTLGTRNVTFDQTGRAAAASTSSTIGGSPTRPTSLRDLRRRYLAGELAAERLLARPAARRRARRSGAASRPRQGTEPLAALLDADRGAARRRRRRLARPSAARRPGRDGGRPGQGRLRPRSAPDQGGVHDHGAARRDRRPHAGDRADARGGHRGALRRLGRHRRLPHRPAPEHHRPQLRRHQLAAVPDPARRADPAAGARTCSRRARTSAPPTSRTAAIGSTPVEWTIGEAAGALVAHAKQTGEPPRQIRTDPKRLAAFQQALRSQGFELEWPTLRPL